MSNPSSPADGDLKPPPKILPHGTTLEGRLIRAMAPGGPFQELGAICRAAGVDYDQGAIAAMQNLRRSGYVRHLRMRPRGAWRRLDPNGR